MSFPGRRQRVVLQNYFARADDWMELRAELRKQFLPTKIHALLLVSVFHRLYSANLASAGAKIFDRLEQVQNKCLLLGHLQNYWAGVHGIRLGVRGHQPQDGDPADLPGLLQRND